MERADGRLSDSKSRGKGEWWAPGRVYTIIRDPTFFRKNKLFDKDLSIEHEGKLYRLRCNDRAFTVYRVNTYQGLPPGIPGWPVCIVHESTIFLECRFPGLASDYLTCRLELDDWLEMVQQYCRRDLDI